MSIFMPGTGNDAFVPAISGIFLQSGTRAMVRYSYALSNLNISLWGKMPDLQKQKIENMSIFLASWMYLMVLIDNSSFFVIKHCTFNV